MATQITSTNDVGRVSTASNADGSLRWHVYERDLGGGVVSIFVQREVSGMLEPEVRFVLDGEKPEIYFDSATSQWLLLYVFNENVWMYQIDENDAPTTRGSQLGTFIVHMRVDSTDADVIDSIAKQQLENVDTRGPHQATSGPKAPLSVGIGASSTPGFFVVRWVPQTPNDSTIVAGFNVYRKDYHTGAVKKVNPSLLPYEGSPVVHEYETPARAGYWMVVQVDQRGPGSSALVEGRIGAPKDLVHGTGKTLPTIIDSFMGNKLDEGDTLQITVTGSPPIGFIVNDSFVAASMGSSEGPGASISNDFDILDIGPPDDTFDRYGISGGESFTVEQTGFGSIVVG